MPLKKSTHLFSPPCCLAVLSIQDDFSEFAEVDDLYQSLPLEKMEALENMEAVPAVPVSIVVKEKVCMGPILWGPYRSMLCILVMGMYS